MRLVLRTVLTLTLLLGGAVGFWTPAPAEATHASCCCGEAADQEDACPCPKPERAPGQQRTNACGQRVAPVALQAARQTQQAQRRAEAFPAPRAWDGCLELPSAAAAQAPQGGRDPDLGRHLARVGVFRI